MILNYGALETKGTPTDDVKEVKVHSWPRVCARRAMTCLKIQSSPRAQEEDACRSHQTQEGRVHATSANPKAVDLSEIEFDPAAEETQDDNVLSNPQEGLAVECHATNDNVHISNPAFSFVGKKYAGSFWHPSFGYDDFPISVEITCSTSGRWTTMEQTLDITVSIQDNHVTLHDGDTKLVGEIDACGKIHGTVLQDGDDAQGSFRLFPPSDSMALWQRAHPTLLQALPRSTFVKEPSTSICSRNTWRPQELSGTGDRIKKLGVPDESIPSKIPSKVSAHSKYSDLKFLEDVASSVIKSDRPDQQLHVETDHKYAVTIAFGEQMRDWHLWEPCEVRQRQGSPAKRACGTYFAVRSIDGDWDVAIRQESDELSETLVHHGSKSRPIFLRIASDGKLAILSYQSPVQYNPNRRPYDAWRVVDTLGRWLIETRDLKQGHWVARTHVAEESDFRITAKKGAGPQPQPPPPLREVPRFSGQAVQCYVVHMEGEREADYDVLCRGLERIVEYGGPDIQVHMQPARDTRDLNEAEVSELDKRGALPGAASPDFVSRSLGCLLSHADIWLKRAQSTDPVPWIVLEDDAVLNTSRNIPHLIGESLHALQPPWDLVLLGAWAPGDQSVGQWINGCNVGPIKEFYGTFAYVITRRGAQRALAAVWGGRESPSLGHQGKVRWNWSAVDNLMADAAKAQRLNVLMCMPFPVLHPGVPNGGRFEFKRMDYEFCRRDELECLNSHSLRHSRPQSHCLRWSMIHDITWQVSEYRRASKR
mmetsp:Transcript_44719/g.83965  ORF Transcript_44719/g.83965 Transcript_44719/m.83965 type:complete len:763 (-) Transcript_44719:27-2315(-)